MRYGLCLAMLLALTTGTAGAEERYKFFPRKQPSGAVADKAVRPISFGPEFGDERAVPRIGSPARTVAKAPPPMLFETSASATAYRLSAPPEPTLASPPVGPPPAPGPVYETGPAPVYEAGPAPEFSVQPVPSEGSSVSLLYPKVRYKDLKNVHPCAVPVVVAVADPCHDCGCVYVQICVPPHCCPRIKCKHSGREVEYQYGKYEVEIKSKNGCIEVDYDD